MKNVFSVSSLALLALSVSTVSFADDQIVTQISPDGTYITSLRDSNGQILEGIPGSYEQVDSHTVEFTPFASPTDPYSHNSDSIPVFRINYNNVMKLTAGVGVYFAAKETLINFAEVEGGMGGGRIGIGYTTSSSGLATSLGQSIGAPVRLTVTADVLRTWGNPGVTVTGQTYAGGSIDMNVANYIHASVGILKAVQSLDPKHTTLLTFGGGISTF